MPRTTREPLAVGLTADRIVACALDLIDRDGLDSFSVRTVARELAVNPTAITWHVGTRDQLLSAVTQLVLADLGAPLRRAPWDQRIRMVARRFRAAVHAHPNTAALIGTRLTSNLGDHLGVLEVLLDALHAAGLSGRRQRLALDAVVGSVIGFVTVELAAPPSDHVGFADEVRRRVDAVDPVAMPHVAAHRAALADRSFVTRWTSGTDAPLDDAFETMLDLLLAGIRATGRATDPSSR